MLTIRKNQNEKRDDSFPALFEQLFETSMPSFFSDVNRSSMPAVNVAETKTEFRVEVAAPGMKKEDFKIRIHGNQLEISAEQEQEKNDTKGNKNDDWHYTRREFNHSSFSRFFTLPETVNSNDIHCEYNDGLLKIVLPKKEEAIDKGPREIKIS